MAERVRQAREEFQEKKERMLKEVEPVTEKLLKGTAYSDWELVKLISGKWSKIKVFALSEGNILTIMNDFPDISFENLTLNLKNQQFYIAVASLATNLPRETLEKSFVMGTCLQIALKAMQISGYGRQQEIDDFLKQIEEKT